jgi:predicted RNase H-like HicB family nuclease
MARTKTRTRAEGYLDRPYHITLVHDRDEEGNEGWVAEVAELPGCLSQGDTPAEAVENVRDAMLGWISVALEDGRPIPEPRREQSYSGRFLVRLPRSLHAALASKAEREGVSLNQYVTTALAFVAGRSVDTRSVKTKIRQGTAEPLEVRFTEHELGWVMSHESAMFIENLSRSIGESVEETLEEFSRQTLEQLSRKGTEKTKSGR